MPPLLFSISKDADVRMQKGRADTHVPPPTERGTNIDDETL